MLNLKVLVALCGCLLVSCTSVPTSAERVQAADVLAMTKSWQSTTLQTGIFTLAAYLPGTVVPAETLTVYIEGDGLAWVSRDTPSADPTPRDPIGLKLALAHPVGAAVYLARPCQYVGGTQAAGCGQTYWTGKRFSPEVVAATSVAVDTLKSRFSARQIQLVGYSGGGAIAALLAAQRTDVALLVTVAGNLDTHAWATHFRVTSLNGSLNPADFSVQLAKVKQVHLAGAADQIVPSWVGSAFASRFAQQDRPEIRILNGYDHACCWAKNWAQLWLAMPY